MVPHSPGRLISCRAWTFLKSPHKPPRSNGEGAGPLPQKCASFCGGSEHLRRKPLLHRTLCQRRVTTRVSNTYEDGSSENIQVRSEVEAPFRAVRFVFFGFFVVSALVGAAIASTQVIGALGKAPNALPLSSTLESLGIDLGAAALFGFLFSRDWKARERQMARLTREERLGTLPLALGNGRRVKLSALRSFSRVVLVAGSAKQVGEAIAAAEPFKSELLKRGVLIVRLPIFEPEAAQQPGSGAAEGDADAGSNLRWVADGLQLDKWRAWFSEQAGLASARTERGLYVGLRLDGRVRASGTGCPPWPRFAAELAPMEGMWQGFFDGFDGKV